MIFLLNLKNSKISFLNPNPIQRFLYLRVSAIRLESPKMLNGTTVSKLPRNVSITKCTLNTYERNLLFSFYYIKTSTDNITYITSDVTTPFPSNLENSMCTTTIQNKLENLDNSPQSLQILFPSTK